MTDSDMKMRILELVKAGDLTVDQGSDLLDALERSRRGAPDQPWEERVQQWSQRFEDVVKEGREQFPEVVEGVLKRIDSSLSRLSGTVHAFDRVYSGMLAEGEDQVEISTPRGEVVIEGWSEDSYRLEISKRVRHENETEARRLAAAAGDVIQDESGLRIGGEADPRVSLSYHVHLPVERGLQLNIENQNGRVGLRGVQAEAVHVLNINGRVSASQVETRRAVIQVRNGDVRWNGTVTDLTVQTGSGRITVIPTGWGDGGRSQLRTQTGSLRVRGRDLPPARYQVKTRTGVGTVNQSFPEHEAGDEREELPLVEIDAYAVVGSIDLDLKERET